MLDSRSPLACHSTCLSVHMPIPNPQSIPPYHLSPSVTIGLFSKSVVLFLFCKQVHLHLFFFFLDSIVISISQFPEVSSSHLFSIYESVLAKMFSTFASDILIDKSYLDTLYIYTHTYVYTYMHVHPCP